MANGILPLSAAQQIKHKLIRTARRVSDSKSAEHKKSFSEATWIFCMEPNCFGIIKGEQPLIRGSSASKSLALFWFSFVRQKRTNSARLQHIEIAATLPR